MSDWRNDSGQTFLGVNLAVQELVESELGQVTATYTPPGGVAAPLPGILLARRALIEDIGEYVGRIDTERRYKCQRVGRDLSTFPKATDNARHGTLTAAGQTFPVMGVGYEHNSHITLFLGDPLA